MEVGRPLLCPARLLMEVSGRQEAPTAPAPSPTPASPGGPPNALLLKGPDGESRVLFIFPLGSLLSCCVTPESDTACNQGVTVSEQVRVLVSIEAPWAPYPYYP